MLLPLFRLYNAGTLQQTHYLHTCLNLVFPETYGGMSASPSVRLMAPSITHPGLGVRPSPIVRPLSNAAPGVRMIPAGATAAAATLTSIPAVSMPNAPTPKRKREDDDDYDLT